MFCRKILMSSSSAIYCLDLLFLIESKNCIKHAYNNFYTVVVYCVEYKKNTKSIFFILFIIQSIFMLIFRP
jgi:hypothetical protein